MCAGHVKRIAKPVVRPRVAGIQQENLAIGGDGLREEMAFAQCVGKIEMGIGKCVAYADGAVQGLQSLGNLPPRTQHHAEVVPGSDVVLI